MALPTSKTRSPQTSSCAEALGEALKALPNIEDASCQSPPGFVKVARGALLGSGMLFGFDRELKDSSPPKFERDLGAASSSV